MTTYPNENDATAPARQLAAVSAGTPHGFTSRAIYIAADGDLTIAGVTMTGVLGGMYYPIACDVVDACPAGTIAWG